MTIACTSLNNLLSIDFQDHNVAVEFEAGGLLKKALGVLTCIGPDFVRLERPSDTEFVEITIFYGNECPIQECATEIVIKKCRIIAVELCPEFGTCPPTLFPTVCPII